MEALASDGAQQEVHREPVGEPLEVLLHAWLYLGPGLLQRQQRRLASEAQAQWRASQARGGCCCSWDRLPGRGPGAAGDPGTAVTANKCVEHDAFISLLNA